MKTRENAMVESLDLPSTATEKQTRDKDQVSNTYIYSQYEQILSRSNLAAYLP